MGDREPGDAFLGYRFRMMEESIDRLASMLLQSNLELKRAIVRIEKKIDALAQGASPEETRKLIADIDANTVQIEKVAAAEAATAGQLGKLVGE